MGSNGSRRLLMLPLPLNVTINSHQSRRYVSNYIVGSDRRSNHRPLLHQRCTRPPAPLATHTYYDGHGAYKNHLLHLQRWYPIQGRPKSLPHTPATRVGMGVVDPEEPIAMHTRSLRQATPMPPESQDEPIAIWTRSRLQRQANIVSPAMAASCRYPASIFQYLALPVFDKEKGKLLEYRQLQKDPRYAPIWNPSYTNKLCQL